MLVSEWTPMEDNEGSLAGSEIEWKLFERTCAGFEPFQRQCIQFKFYLAIL